MSMLFHFVRHAPVIGQDGIAYGRDAAIDESCTDLFQAAAAQLPQDNVLWIASEFPRAQRTARLLQDTMAIKKPLIIQDIFNEQNFGKLAGKPKTEILADPENRAFLKDMARIAPPGGESVPQMVERVSRGLHDLAGDLWSFRQREAVIVCHGGVIRSAHHLNTGADFDLHQKVPHLSVHSLSFDL